MKILSLILFTTTFCFGETQLHRFTNDLLKLGISIPFLRDASDAVSKITIRNYDQNTYAKYGYFSNKMKIAKTITINGLLIPTSQMDITQITTIVHELWHAYMDVYLSDHTEISTFMDDQTKTSQYSPYSQSESLRMMEEIHAEFIGNLAGMLVYYSRLISRNLNCETYQKLTKTPNLQRQFTQALNLKPDAYDTKWSVKWEENPDHILDLLDISFVSVFKNVSITKMDKEFIYKHVFKNKFPNSYNEMIDHFWKVHLGPYCSSLRD